MSLVTVLFGNYIIKVHADIYRPNNGDFSNRTLLPHCYMLTYFFSMFPNCCHPLETLLYCLTTNDADRDFYRVGIGKL